MPKSPRIDLQAMRFPSGREDTVSWLCRFFGKEKAFEHPHQLVVEVSKALLLSSLTFVQSSTYEQLFHVSDVDTER